MLRQARRRLALAVPQASSAWYVIPYIKRDQQDRVIFLPSLQDIPGQGVSSILSEEESSARLQQYEFRIPSPRGTCRFGAYSGPIHIWD